ncbi:MAG: hypothetical protein AAFV53_17805 [Myxococcota bacterium]
MENQVTDPTTETQPPSPNPQQEQAENSADSPSTAAAEPAAAAEPTTAAESTAAAEPTTAAESIAAAEPAEGAPSKAVVPPRRVSSQVDPREEVRARLTDAQNRAQQVERRTRQAILAQPLLAILIAVVIGFFIGRMVRR